MPETPVTPAPQAKHTGRNILIACFLVVVVIYGLNHDRRSSTSNATRFTDDSAAPARDAGSAEGNRQLVQRELANLQAQQAQLQPKMNACAQQIQQFTDQMRNAAMNGQMMMGQPACEPYMQQWIAQEAYLETEIYKLQTGDTKATVSQVSGIPINTGSSSSSRSGSSAGQGDPEGRFARNAIRETSLYKDPDGEEHELPTRNYYFRDRVTGQFVGSDLSDPPNDGHDYEPLQNLDSPN